MLACYLISTGDAYLYCEDWINNTECLSVGNMSSQRISELLYGIESENRNTFYEEWLKYRSEKEYLALDITSISSYSELIEDVEWGYNRDGENLPQINLCMLLGEESRLPVYQVPYSGSLKDVSTLKTTMDNLLSLAPDRKAMIVMDKGFCSKRNINELLNDSHKIRFIIALPFTMSFAKKQIASEIKDIDSINNTISIASDSFRGITKIRTWNNEHKLYTHIYYNAVKAAKAREELFSKVMRLKALAIDNPNLQQHAEDFKKYLIIRKSEKTEGGLTVNIKDDVIQKELETAGWMVLVSNDISEAKEAISIYRDKDVVEKGFLRLKNNLDLGRLRVHSGTSMQNKLFIGFIALIVMSHIHKTMSEQNLYKNMTMKKMLKILENLKVQKIKENRIMYPLNKQQKTIFKAFGIEEPS